MRLVTIFMATLACMYSGSAADAASFTNGSFEDLTSSYVDSPGADHMNGGVADSWLVGMNSPDWFWGEGPEGLWTTPFGDHFMMCAATGFVDGGVYREGINQVVSGFTPGEDYTIGFHHANGLYFDPNPFPGGYIGVGTTGGWQVLVDGGSVLVASSTNDNSIAAPEHPTEWDASSVTFTATAASHDISFVAWTPDGPSLPTFQFLDAVTVESASGGPTPVPMLGNSQLLLLIAALAASAALKHSKH
ncbi:MAG: hypothetical protein ACI8W3_001175 [Myxococcota bacterium]|jgi:hypothetical protein